MALLFMYETLNREKVVEQIFGEVPYPVRPATIRGWREGFTRGKNRWPTLVDSGGYVEGTVIAVTTDDFERLDKWNPKYKRVVVYTNRGHAWTYVYKG